MSVYLMPTQDRWDLVLLVRQQSVAQFSAFARNEAFLSGIGHRTAAIEEARPLPVTEGKLQG